MDERIPALRRLTVGHCVEVVFDYSGLDLGFA